MTKTVKQSIKDTQVGDTFELCVPVKVVKKNATGITLNNLNGGTKMYTIAVSAIEGPMKAKGADIIACEDDKVSVVALAKRPGLWSKIVAWFKGQ